jgi:hypothetical protein
MMGFRLDRVRTYVRSAEQSRARRSIIDLFFLLLTDPSMCDVLREHALGRMLPIET